MNEVDYLHQSNSTNQTSEDKLDTKTLGVHQDDVINQIAVLPAGVQQVLVVKEEVPWSPSLELLYIKKEEEGLWTSQEGEQLHGQKETDISKFKFTVKIENDEESQSSKLRQIKTEDKRETEPPTSSSAEQMETETDGEDCGGAEPTRNPDPNTNLQAVTDEKVTDSFETGVSVDGYWQKPRSDSASETEDSDSDWKDSRVPESGGDRNVGCDTTKKPFSCSHCYKQFLYKRSFQKHLTCHSGKSSSRMVDGKRFGGKQSIDSQIREKQFVCDVCGQRYNRKTELRTHMRVHTGERPFKCGYCGKGFTHQGSLKRHVRLHTGEKPFGCNDCGKRFRQHCSLTAHMRVHTGEKPFGCDLCGQMFNQRANLLTHMKVHTGEKPFNCDNCGKRFNRRTHLKRHMRVHSQV